MKLSKQHQLYVGILGVAAIGLIADRTILRPSEAVASTDEYLIDSSDDSVAEITTVAPNGQADSLAKRLTSFGASHQLNPLEVNDVFLAVWKPLPDAPIVTDQPEIEGETAADFTKQHRLTAVMGAGASGQNGYVIVDGKCLRIGQSVGDWRLVTVGRRAATFAFGNQTAELLVQVEGQAAEKIAERQIVEPQDKASPVKGDNPVIAGDPK